MRETESFSAHLVFQIRTRSKNIFVLYGGKMYPVHKQFKNGPEIDFYYFFKIPKASFINYWNGARTQNHFVR